MITGEGIIKFDPRALTNADTLFKPWWCVILLYESDDTGDYYSWFIEKRYGIKIQRPAFGNHISLVRGEETTEDKWEMFKNKYDGKPVKFYHDSELRTNGKHWWIRIISEESKDMREEMGYSRDPQFPFHLTIGMPTPRYEQRSYDTMRMIENFPHISHELIYLK